MRWLAVVVVSAGLAAGGPQAGSAQEPDTSQPGITQLAWLIGEWTFEDIEIDGDYRESGTRVCEYALGGDYIACESRGVNHRGVERIYLWYFNYNDRDQRFEITSLFQVFPRKLLYTATLRERGHRLELSGGAWEGDQIVIDAAATVVYNGSDQYVWGTDRFRDVVTRR